MTMPDDLGSSATPSDEQEVQECDARDDEQGTKSRATIKNNFSRNYLYQ